MRPAKSLVGAIPESTTATPMLLKPDVSATRGSPSVSRSVVMAGSTVIGALVASEIQLSFAQKRTSYVPAVIGAVKVIVVDVSPTGGRVVAPLRYFHETYWLLLLPTAFNVTQSLTLPGPLAIVTENVPPGFTAVGAVTAGVGWSTVIDCDVASLVQPSLAKNRTLYVPVPGATNRTVAFASPMAGRVVEPLRYLHCTPWLSAPAAGTSATQSLMFAGPLAMATEIAPPGSTDGA